MTDTAYNALIQLIADICKRNNIKELKWKADPSLIGQVDKQNMTVHKWFAKKDCPGAYLYERHGDIATKVNALLNAKIKPTTNEIKVGSTVRLKKGSKTFQGGNLASFVYERNHQVKQINVDRVVITYNGIVVAAVRKSDLTVIN